MTRQQLGSVFTILCVTGFSVCWCVSVALCVAALVKGMDTPAGLRLRRYVAIFSAAGAACILASVLAHRLLPP